ncbi:MAG: NAD(P)H-hydrate dehydratase [Desulfobacterales bacterium]|nr:NAD(P)H-hydrate dehydratase [Desulfobacterales bacterium]
MYLVTAAEMQKMDKMTIESFGLPGIVLMENAGRGAVQFFFKIFSEDLKKKNQKIGIICGRGNNGGDGFVIARYLSQKDIDVTVFLLGTFDLIKGDAATNLKLLFPLNIKIVEMPDHETFFEYKTLIAEQNILVDAIFGTGLKSEVKGYFKEIIDFINQLEKPVFAVDIPSGLNSDSGEICGTCVKALATATFGFHKIGHIILNGQEYTGILELIDIGIPNYIVKSVNPQHILLTNDLVKSYFKKRPNDSHKGMNGHVFVIGGAPGKTGAPAMASMAALRAGAGLVTLGIAKSLNPILESIMLEAMTAPLQDENGIIGLSAFEEIIELIQEKTCIALGPGIGINSTTKELIFSIIQKSNIPIVIDADAINCLAQNVNILKAASAPIILTPHPGEMARLLGQTTKDVQKNRIALARDFAVNYKVYLVLKGAQTIIVNPDGYVYINSAGNPGMASGGMGDVLTGVIAAFIAQGYSIERAVQMGVYIHSAAADRLYEKLYGFLASDVMDEIPVTIKQVLTL